MKKIPIITGLILSLSLAACSSAPTEELKPVATIQQTDHLEEELAKLNQKLNELEKSIQDFDANYQAKQSDMLSWQDQISTRVEDSSQFINNLKKQVAALGGVVETIPAPEEKPATEGDDEFSDLFGGTKKSEDQGSDTSGGDSGDLQFDDLFGQWLLFGKIFHSIQAFKITILRPNVRLSEHGCSVDDTVGHWELVLFAILHGE